MASRKDILFVTAILQINACSTVYIYFIIVVSALQRASSLFRLERWFLKFIVANNSQHSNKTLAGCHSQSVFLFAEVKTANKTVPVENDTSTKYIRC